MDELVVDDDAHAISDDDGRKLEDILVANVWGRRRRFLTNPVVLVRTLCAVVADGVFA